MDWNCKTRQVESSTGGSTQVQEENPVGTFEGKVVTQDKEAEIPFQDTVYYPDGSTHPLTWLLESDWLVDVTKEAGNRSIMELRQVCKGLYCHIRELDKDDRYRTLGYKDFPSIDDAIKHVADCVYLKKIHWMGCMTINGQELTSNQVIQIYAAIASDCPFLEEIATAGSAVGTDEPMFESIEKIVEFLERFPRLKTLRIEYITIKNPTEVESLIDLSSDPVMRKAFYQALVNANKGHLLPRLDFAGMAFDSLDEFMDLAKHFYKLDELPRFGGSAFGDETTLQINNSIVSKGALKYIYLRLFEAGVQVKRFVDSLTFETIAAAASFFNQCKGLEDLELGCIRIGEGDSLAKDSNSAKRFYFMLEGSVLDTLRSLKLEGMVFSSKEEAADLLTRFKRLEGFNSNPGFQLKDTRIASTSILSPMIPISRFWTYNDLCYLTDRLIEANCHFTIDQVLKLQTSEQEPYVVTVPSLESLANWCLKSFERLRWNDLKDSVRLELPGNNIKAMDSTDYGKLLKLLAQSSREGNCLRLLDLGVFNANFATEQEALDTLDQLFNRFDALLWTSLNRHLMIGGKPAHPDFMKTIYLKFCQGSQRNDYSKLKPLKPNDDDLKIKKAYPHQVESLYLGGCSFDSIKDCVDYLTAFGWFLCFDLNGVTIAGQYLGQRSHSLQLQVIQGLSQFESFSVDSLDLKGLNFASEKELLALIKAFGRRIKHETCDLGGTTSQPVTFNGESLSPEAYEALLLRIKEECGVSAF